MKEALFIHQNLEKWKQYEDELSHIDLKSPDTLADIYIDVTNDLSFAQTHYPDSKIVTYLNGLSSKLHQFINEKKKMKFSQLFDFWKVEVPLLMYERRKEFGYAFLIFIVSMLIGMFSSANDETYSRLILSNHYVDMTIENIEKGDPMAVYKKQRESQMFWAIALNNVRVAINTFIYGLFTSVAAAFILVSNGIMVGSFQYFFYDYDLTWYSFLTIWQHGTLEISAIIIAGCAGLTMGNGWLFPKTYSRIDSFKRGAKQGVKILIGVIPVILLAAFIESYITRLTHLPDLVRLLVIIGSLAFVLFYYVIYPRRIAKQLKYDDRKQS